jgi:hypothetical protein
VHPPSAEAPRDQAQPTLLLLLYLVFFLTCRLGYKVHIGELLTESSSVLSRTVRYLLRPSSVQSLHITHTACLSCMLFSNSISPALRDDSKSRVKVPRGICQIRHRLAAVCKSDVSYKTTAPRTGNSAGRTLQDMFGQGVTLRKCSLFGTPPYAPPLVRPIRAAYSKQVGLVRAESLTVPI